MGVRVFALVGMLLCGCYSPRLERDCEVSCASSGQCPSGFTCEAGSCRVTGFTGACGSIPMDDAKQQTDSHVADTSMPDLVCGFTCFTPSETASPIGSAPCRNMPNGCQTNNAWIDPIALCSCSAGEPELYVQRVGASINVALVGPQLAAGHGYSMTIDNGVCYGTGAVCPASSVAGCSTSSEVDGWILIPMPAGPTTTFRFFDDDGTGCAGGPNLTFVVAL